MMHIRRSLSLIWLLGAILSSTARAQSADPIPPECPASTCVSPIASTQLDNLGQLKDEITTYYRSGAYDAEAKTIDDDAIAYLRSRLTQKVSNPAIVLDIDDTAVQTFGYEIKHDFGFDAASWEAEARAGFPAIPSTLALAKVAQQLGVSVFFVTGRRAPEQEFTERNLRDDGYVFSKVYLRPVDDHSKSVVPYKSGVRAALERSGYTVIETVGDQWSDLQGGHAERAYKLPNPMYFIP